MRGESHTELPSQQQPCLQKTSICADETGQERRKEKEWAQTLSVFLLEKIVTAALY